MVWCSHCGKNVTGLRPYDGALACNLCGRILENYNYSNDVQFVKNAAGQSQASGNIVSSVQSGISSSRERRYRIARYEFVNLKDALEIGTERDDVVDRALHFFTIAVEQNFTKGRRTELVQSSCLYLACRQKKIAVLLIDFSSYLRVSVYELGSVYLQLCELLYIADDKNYEKLVDPSIFIPRFSNILLKGGREEKAVAKTARDIIASMKRDWMQTGRKPSGICGAALYVAALSHGIKCSKSDIVKIVHICVATLTKRLIEFGHTEAASLTVDELGERERVLEKRPFTLTPHSNEGGRKLCKHQDSDGPFTYGLCSSCHKDFVTLSGGLVGGSDPPAFQRAEKERMEKAAARDENDGGCGSLNQLNAGEKPCSEKGDGDYTEASDESGNLSDVDDSEVDDIFLTEEEKLLKTTVFNLENKDYFEKQAAKAFMASNASNADSPDYARKLVEASNEAVKKARKEKQQKRAEEAKNAPPPATAMDSVCRMLEKKRISGLINYDILEELFDTSPSPKRSKINTYMEGEDMEREEGSEHEDSDELVESILL